MSADDQTDSRALNGNDEPARPPARILRGQIAEPPLNCDAALYLVGPAALPSAKAEARALPLTRHADGHDSAGKATASPSKPPDLPRDESPLAAASGLSRAGQHVPPEEGPGSLLLDSQQQHPSDSHTEAGPGFAAALEAASAFLEKAEHLVPVSTSSNEIASHQMAHQAADHGLQLEAPAAKKLSGAASTRTDCLGGVPAVSAATHDTCSHSSQNCKQEEPASLGQSAPASASGQLPAESTACSSYDCKLADAALGGSVLEDLRQAAREMSTLVARKHDLKRYLMCKPDETQTPANRDEGRLQLQASLQAAVLDSKRLRKVWQMSQLSSQQCIDAAQGLVDRVCATAGQHLTSLKPDLPTSGSGTAAWMRACQLPADMAPAKGRKCFWGHGQADGLHQRFKLLATLEK